jgi:hypothetical protein
MYSFFYNPSPMPKVDYVLGAVLRKELDYFSSILIFVKSNGLFLRGMPSLDKYAFLLLWSPINEAL